MMHHVIRERGRVHVRQPLVFGDRGDFLVGQVGHVHDVVERDHRVVLPSL